MRSTTAVIVIIAATFIAVPRLASQTNSDWQWMDEHFGKAFDELFPIDQRSGGFVAYRSHRDLYTDVPEYAFVLGRMPLDNACGLHLSVRVRMAEGRSVYDQMMALRQKQPNQPFAEMQGSLRVKEWTLTEMNCPAVRSQFELFQRLQFSPPKFDEIVIHPLVHEVWVQGGTGNMRIEVYDEHNSLVEWALGARRAFDACTKKTH